MLLNQAKPLNPRRQRDIDDAKLVAPRELRRSGDKPRRDEVLQRFDELLFSLVLRRGALRLDVLVEGGNDDVANLLRCETGPTELERVGGTKERGGEGVVEKVEEGEGFVEGASLVLDCRDEAFGVDGQEVRFLYEAEGGKGEKDDGKGEKGRTFAYGFTSLYSYSSPFSSSAIHTR